MEPHKYKVKKEIPNFIVYIAMVMVTPTGIALISYVITRHLFFLIAGISGAIVTIILYFMTTEYGVMNIQNSFREGGELDLSLYLCHLAEVEYTKFGKYNKKNVKLRLDVLEKDLKIESHPNKRKLIIMELKGICKIFGYKKKHSHYNKRLREIGSDIIKQTVEQKEHKEGMVLEDSLDELEDNVNENIIEDEIHIKEVR